MSVVRQPAPSLFTPFPSSFARFGQTQVAIVDSVLACEREQQASLLNGVVLAGGGCCFEGLQERLKGEIEGCLDAPSTGWRVKVLAAGANERK